MNNKILVPRIVWLALLTSVLVYAFLTQTIAAKQPTQSPMELPLSTIAGMMFLASIALPAFLFKQFLANPDLTRDKIVENCFAPFVVRMALLESIATLGLVLSLSAGAQKSYPFFIVAFIAMLTCFPSEDRFARYAESVNNGDLPLW